MEWHQLKNLLPPVELEVVKLEMDPAFKWLGKIDKTMDEFKMDYRETTLSNNQVIVPVLTNDVMLPFETIAGKKTVFPYTPFVDAVVTYRRCHLVQVEQRFGIKSLKENDRRYTNEWVSDTQVAHLIFDSEEGRWKYSHNLSVWRHEHEHIEKAYNSLSWRDIVKGYYESRERLESLLKVNPGDYQMFLREVDHIIKSHNLFFRGLRYFGMISKAHHGYIERDFELIKNAFDHFKTLVSEHSLKGWQDSMNVSDPAYTVESRIIPHFQLLLRDRFFQAAYHIDPPMIFPSMGEWYLQIQKSEQAANQQTQENLKKRLLGQASGQYRFILIKDLIR